MKNKFPLLLAGLLFICLAGWNIYQHLSIPRTAYILIQEVYNGFELKKEMEKKFVQTKNARDKVLDSLALEVQLLGKRIEAEQQKNTETIARFNAKREEYYQRRETYEDDNNALSRQYDQEILTQLNQYVKDFGKEHNYTYIFGNDGNGSLMYGKDAKNITAEVTEYINDKYRGVK